MHFRLVSGAGDIKITKDGNVLLHEMQIQHPTASLIARASTAQDDMTGDGTTSIVLIIGELLKQADIYVSEGLHPRVVTEGFDKARVKTLEILDKVKIPIELNKENLFDVARTSLKTKVEYTQLFRRFCCHLAILGASTSGGASYRSLCGCNFVHKTRR